MENQNYEVVAVVSSPNELASLNLENLSKKEIVKLGQQKADESHENGEDLLMTVCQSAKVELFTKTFKDAGKKNILEEVRKYGSAGVSKYGVTLTISSTSELDYSADPQWVRLSEQAKKAAEALKERQEFLKRIPYTGIMTVDEETGEEYRVYPPSKSTSETIKATIK